MVCRDAVIEHGSNSFGYSVAAGDRIGLAAKIARAQARFFQHPFYRPHDGPACFGMTKIERVAPARPFRAI